MRQIIVFVFFVGGLATIGNFYEPLENNFGMPMAPLICFTSFVLLLFILNKFWEGQPGGK